MLTAGDFVGILRIDPKTPQSVIDDAEGKALLQLWGTDLYNDYLNNQTQFRYSYILSKAYMKQYLVPAAWIYLSQQGYTSAMGGSYQGNVKGSQFQQNPILLAITFANNWLNYVFGVLDRNRIIKYNLTQISFSGTVYTYKIESLEPYTGESLDLIQDGVWYQNNKYNVVALDIANMQVDIDGLDIPSGTVEATPYKLLQTTPNFFSL